MSNKISRYYYRIRDLDLYIRADDLRNEVRKICVDIKNDNEIKEEEKASLFECLKLELCILPCVNQFVDMLALYSIREEIGHFLDYKSFRLEDAF